jgi:hypothetical protein
MLLNAQQDNTSSTPCSQVLNAGNKLLVRMTFAKLRKQRHRGLKPVAVHVG